MLCNFKMQLTWIYRKRVTVTKYDHEITHSHENARYTPRKDELFLKTIYFRVHHGGTSAELLDFRIVTWA